MSNDVQLHWNVQGARFLERRRRPHSKLPSFSIRCVENRAEE
jgi:hypothetical protein